MSEENELCGNCNGSGEGKSNYNDHTKCIECNGSGIEKQLDECANCNTEIDNTTKIAYVQRFCSNECFDEHTDKWG